MSTNNARAAPAGRSPLFGVEIEIYVKVKAKLEALTREKKRTNPSSLPDYWQAWDFDLKNDDTNMTACINQRKQVSKAITAIIDGVLGPNNGWKCEADASLNDSWLVLPNDPKKWWGVEIISPPISRFEFWTNEFCACQVHISPGPTKDNNYTLAQLVRMAKGVYFWEYALCDLISPQRRHNTYINAKPNHAVFATNEYHGVPRRGWGPVFETIDSAASGRLGQTEFLSAITGGRDKTRFLLTNFCPVVSLGTVELRRQAGVASATTTIHRILLAVTLHISALRYDFDGARTKSRLEHPRGEELIKELAGCIKRLPETCHVYDNSKFFTEEQINAREEALRKGNPPPHQISSQPFGETTSTAPSQRPPATRAPATSAASGGSTPARAPTSQGSAPQASPASHARANRDAAPQGGQGSTTAPRTPAGRAPAPQGGGGQGPAASRPPAGRGAPQASPAAANISGSAAPRPLASQVGTTQLSFAFDVAEVEVEEERGCGERSSK
ncbi:hypothetical protein C8A01DRAFT_45928 [Parachaetomium inaequale]|uniref:Uncharacterized protein n=1 Tax=Parachaetomium inaequale TaxID=2588326 RepID=A0AAN6SRV7_9PEZI|nr:hypothetical protein C8A01DRAFT_45928 [Parachaetomium inaequale]